MRADRSDQEVGGGKFGVPLAMVRQPRVLEMKETPAHPGRDCLKASGINWQKCAIQEASMAKAGAG